MIHLALTALLLTASTVLAQPGLQADHSPESKANTLAISPEAEAALKRVNEFYASLTGAAVIYKMSMDLGNAPNLPGMMPEDSTELEIVQPNLFKITGSTMPVSLQSNGTSFWEYSKEIDSYSRRSAPKTMEQCAEVAFMTGLVPGLIMDTMSVGLENSRLFVDSKSIEVVDGLPSDEIELVISRKGSRGPGKLPNLHIGISKEDPAWLKYVRMEMPDTPQAAPPGPESITYTFSQWKTSDAAPSHFNWTPPQDWKKVDDVMGSVLASMRGGPRGGDKPQSDSIGKPAPDFTLESLDGQTVSLKSLQGNVVILDFWATWCGPCRQGIPVLMEIAESEASRGVVLWTVDLREPPQKVRAFLERSKWDLPVLLDPKGEVAMKYGVGGIPHTVVIGPDGKVVAVEVGFGGPAHTRKAIGMAIDKALQEEGS